MDIYERNVWGFGSYYIKRVFPNIARAPLLDLFSKYGWIVPLKDKKGETVAEAFKTIFKEGRKPQYLWADKGKEYYNKHVNLWRNCWKKIT